MPAPLLYRSAALAALAAVVIGSLPACKPDAAAPVNDALPLATGDAVPPPPAPAVEQLPPAPAVRYVPVAQPQQAYEYIDDAYQMDEAFDDAPPDYGFDYDGTQPWVWRTAADAWRLVEPTSDGDRYYFYEPGASDPYLVRDASYSYAYSEGRLVSVYDSRGYALDRIAAERNADRAARYYARARALRAAAAEDRRQQVIAAQWAQRQARIDRDRAEWRQEQQRIGEWRAYHARYGEARARRLAEERRHRQQQAIAFRDWRARDYAGPPPRVVARQEAKRDWQFWKRQQQHDRQVAEQQRRDDQRRQQLAAQQQRQRAHDDAVRRDQARRDEAQRQQQLRDQRVHEQAQADARRRQHDMAQARADARHQQQLRDQRAKDQAERRQRDKAHALAVAEQKRKVQQVVQAKAQQQKAAVQARAQQAAKAKAEAHARAEQKRKAAQAQARNDHRRRPHERRDGDKPAPNLARN